MDILLLMIPISLGLSLFFLGAFLWTSQKGQNDDLITPAYKILLDEPTERNTREQS